MKKLTAFVSDIHLNDSQPKITQRFIQFLETNKNSIENLYILGDLFDYWIGDDNITPLSQLISQTLRKCTDAGMKIYFIHGNRDYLIGKKFADACGMTLLNEKAVIDLYGTPTLLLHGDLLCTEDQAYQRYRKIMFSPFMKNIALLLPLWLRRKLAKKLRGVSQESNRSKSIMMMDVAEASVLKNFSDYQVQLLIHGHVHRQAMHNNNRMVLGAWSETEGNALIASNATAPYFINFNTPQALTN